jgi:hypothetical protein
MTGLRDIFTELDTQITDTVKFGDRSITKIEGLGSIILICKSGEHHTLTGVYYIPRLKPSIISIDQLDEFNCHVFNNDGVLRIFDQDDQLLAKVTRDEYRWNESI